MKIKVNLLTIWLLIAVFPTNLQANQQNVNQTLNLEVISGEIKNYVQDKLSSQYEGEINVDLLQPNSLLQLKSCDMPISYSLPEHRILSNSSTVKAYCAGSNAWTIYIPIGIKIFQDVIVTNRPMSREEIINSDVISLKKIDITNLSQGYFSDPMHVLGQVMRFPVKAGNVLTPSSITKNKLIKRGERVSINVEDPDVLVHMQGESLEDGGFGDKIKIRNLSSKRIIEATIVAAGKVQIQH